MNITIDLENDEMVLINSLNEQYGVKEVRYGAWGKEVLLDDGTILIMEKPPLRRPRVKCQSNHPLPA